ncbi:MAG: DUF1080 domain-containing protein [Rhodothermales bacterium]|nr:DUF1080 domain-containing protein [Rhodothermales bacterium]
MPRACLATLLFVFVVTASAGCGGDAPPTDIDTPTTAVAATPVLNTLTDAERDAGWQLLFDGSTFDGWRGYRKDHVPLEHWTIEDGVIHKIASGKVPLMADGQPMAGGDIMTVATYENFEVSFDWKVAPGANSGIKYNVVESMSDTNPLGFEYQVLDDDLHPDAMMGRDGNRTAAGLYDLIAPADKALNPAGAWNSGRILFNGAHAEHWLNGKKTLEYDLGSTRMDSLLSLSKYAPIAGFADKRAGHIVLQDHNDDVWYRNIKIRTLSGE